MILHHKKVKVVALCDVDSKALQVASEEFPDAKTFKDYRKMFNEFSNIDAFCYFPPDVTHAQPILAMNNNKHVYCQKPLTHHV